MHRAPTEPQSALRAARVLATEYRTGGPVALAGKHPPSVSIRRGPSVPFASWPISTRVAWKAPPVPVWRGPSVPLRILATQYTTCGPVLCTQSSEPVASLSPRPPRARHCTPQVPARLQPPGATVLATAPPQVPLRHLVQHLLPLITYIFWLATLLLCPAPVAPSS